MVARIMKEKGLDFQIYPNDHLPVHVHVLYDGDEAVFRIENGEVNLYKEGRLPNRQLRDANDIIEENIEQFIDEWNRLNTNSRYES